MKIGDIFKYEIDGQTQIIRKEEAYYITFVPDELAYYELEDFPFQVIKHTVNRTIPNLEKTLIKDYGFTPLKTKRKIRDTQKTLCKISLLSKNLIH
jgi:hypothetical protein